MSLEDFKSYIQAEIGNVLDPENKGFGGHDYIKYRRFNFLCDILTEIKEFEENGIK